MLLRNIKVSADTNSTGTFTVTKRMSVWANQNKQARTITVIAFGYQSHHHLRNGRQWFSGHLYPLTSFAPETPDDNHLGGLHSTSWKKEKHHTFTSFLFETVFRQYLIAQVLTARPTSLKAKRPTGQGTKPIFFKALDKVKRCTCPADSGPMTSPLWT